MFRTIEGLIIPLYIYQPKIPTGTQPLPPYKHERHPLSVFPTIIYIRRSKVFVFLFQFHIHYRSFHISTLADYLSLYITDRHMYFAPMMNRILIVPDPNPAPDRVKFICSHGGKILLALPTAASSTPAVILAYVISQVRNRH
ncbi:hypothetical protein HanHA89_Chr10g0392151 [Helianthus annuus]|nr:hypothetical protein HanHA89_Chr10g0392151 [Helianthus annuus]